MYCLVPEKPLRLVYGTFYLAIGVTFYEFIKKGWRRRKSHLLHYNGLYMSLGMMPPGVYLKTFYERIKKNLALLKAKIIPASRITYMNPENRHFLSTPTGIEYIPLSINMFQNKELRYK